MTKGKSLKDMILATSVSAVAVLLLWIWSYPGLDPHVWTDVAVGAGLLPQGNILPGLGACLSHLVFMALPFDDALVANTVLAKLMVALGGALLFLLLNGAMELVSGQGARDWKRRRLAIRLSSLLASVCFVCADPVWHAAQAVSGSLLVMVEILAAGCFFVRMLQTARYSCAVAALATTGLVCAETPLGWPLLVLGVFLSFRYLRTPPTDAWKEFLDPVRMQRTKWSMTFSFIGMLLVGILLEIVAFAWLDGMKAAGVTYGELPLLYVKAYGDRIVSALDVTGCCLFVFAALIPVVLSSVLIMPATDEDRYLSFKFSIVYFVVGAVAFLQLSPYEFTWFWAVVDGAVRSRPLLLFGSLLSAVTLACSFYVLCVEIFCRDYQHIENVLYQSYSDEDGDEVRPARDDSVPSVRLSFGRLLMLVVPLVILAIVVSGRNLRNDRALLETVYDFIRETIDESSGTRYLFTDGSYDAALRIESRRRGLDLIPVSLMSGASRHDAYVRQLGTTGFDDRMSLEAGAAEALRTWVVTKSEKLSDVSVQLAFEMFRLNHHLSPVVYGLLVRPTGGDAAAAAESVERCHAMADRIVALHESGTWRHAKDSLLKDRFLFAQFRLAVISRLRAIRLDAEKRVKESIAEIAYSDRLNAVNPSLMKILRKMDWVRRQTGDSLTPREGLEVAMKRADFVMARRYAMPVLKEDPDEPNANFAVGMSYYAEEQYAKAEEYLKRVLKRSPNEPAVYNNLALLMLKTGRLSEAEKNVAEALKLLPDSPEVKDTARQIAKAKATKR